ncbi:putative GPI anchored protein [Cladophialophora carrionii]|uniref:Putative GPI anchored protein n=1 Tax=Cladophialophora carrionii TaxID=86049 RepID=A0A1C1CKB4_9EURO|nr:putative GPI anchored protein [Cladophialophora carrionii]
MRFAFAAVAALCAAVVSAQNNAINVPAGAATLDVTAGQPLTIEWTNPSSGTVTIKLQQDPVTPDSGFVLVAGIPASAGTATVQIPPPEDVNSHVYTIEIIDDTDPTNINFSPNFGIQGATGTATGVATGSATSTDSATSTGTSTDSSVTSSGTSTDTSTITSTDSSSSSATSSSSSDSETSASTTSSESRSSTSSATATETTTAPDPNNGAGSLKLQGGVLAMALGLIAVM